MNSKCMNSYIVLSLCSTLLDFMIMPQNQIIFPRDRTVHIGISVLISYLFILIIKNINFYTGIKKIVILIIVAAKTVITINNFINYFNIFYGSNTIGIIILTVITSAMVYNFKEKNIEQLYPFFILSNIFMLSVILIFSADKLNVINIYSNEIAFELSFTKLYLFFDIFTIAAVTPTGKTRIKTQKIYLYAASAICIVLTVMQGLSVQGNMMYSISPLQTLSQIMSGSTVRRFDYIITIFQSVNYFAVITFYIWTIKTFINKSGEVKFE